MWNEDLTYIKHSLENNFLTTDNQLYTFSFNHITSSNDLNVKDNHPTLTLPSTFSFCKKLKLLYGLKATCIDLTGSVEQERAHWLLHNDRSPLHGQEQMIRWSCVIFSRTFWIKFAPVPCKQTARRDHLTLKEGKGNCLYITNPYCQVQLLRPINRHPGK